MLAAAGAIVAWFVFQVALASLMKWTYLYGEVCVLEAGIKNQCLTYQFPFMITAQHMLCCWVVTMFIMRRRPKGEAKGLDLASQFKQIVPIAVIWALSIVLGNVSLKYIFPSFNQMLSSVAPMVTVVFSMLMHGKRYNSWTWVAMPVICGGLLVCGNEEVNYNLVGVICVVVATVLRCVRAVMQEQLLDPASKALDSISLLYYLAPWSGVLLLGLSLCFEGVAPITMLMVSPGEEKTGVARLLVLLALSGTNACFLNISGNMINAYCGAVMLQVLANVKACLAIIVSVAIFRNPVTPAQAMGVICCLFGVWLYNSKGGAVKPPEVGSPPAEAAEARGVAKPAPSSDKGQQQPLSQPSRTATSRSDDPPPPSPEKD